MRKQILGATAVILGAGTLAIGLPAASTQAVGWTDPFTLTADNSGFRNVSVVSTGAGDAVAVWVDGDSSFRVRARVAEDGQWGPATWISPQGINTDYVEIVANDDGDVAATWLSKYDGVNWKARGARLEDDGTWSPSIDLWHNQVHNAPLSTAIDGDGTVHVAFRAPVAAKETIQVRTWEPGQATTGKTIAPEFGASVSVDANEAGQAVLAYGTDQSIDGVYAAEFTPGGGWDEPEQVSFLTDSAGSPDAVIDGTGRSTILFNQKVGDDSSSYRVHAATENQAGSGWTAPAMIAAAGKSTAYLSADTDASGRTLVAWQTNVNGFYDAAYVTRPSTGGAWGTVTSLNVPDHSWQYLYPEVSVSDNGTQLIDYTSGATRITKYRTGPALSFSSLNHGTGYDQLDRVEADVDNDGNAALIEFWNPAVGFDEIRARLLDLAGPTTTLTAPTINRTKNTTIPLRWTATDEVSGVAKTDVSVGSSAWNQTDFGPSTNAIDDSTANHGTYAGTAGRTYCFVARSIDNNNNLGGSSPERCTTVPVDDESLVGGAAWKRVTNVDGHFLKTYSTTKQQGAVLVLKGVKAQRLALVIHKTANGGKAIVKLGTQTLRTVNFAGVGTRKVVKLATFDEVRSGRIRIRVITDGKRVDVDGLVVAK